jgi:hypothetical protein
MKLKAGWEGFVDLLNDVGLGGLFRFAGNRELWVERLAGDERLARDERKRRDIQPTWVRLKSVKGRELLRRLSRRSGSWSASR